jgi:hypothetical protein
LNQILASYFFFDFLLCPGFNSCAFFCPGLYAEDFGPQYLRPPMVLQSTSMVEVGRPTFVVVTLGMVVVAFGIVLDVGTGSRTNVVVVAPRVVVGTTPVGTVVGVTVDVVAPGAVVVEMFGCVVVEVVNPKTVDVALPCGNVVVVTVVGHGNVKNDGGCGFTDSSPEHRASAEPVQLCVCETTRSDTRAAIGQRPGHTLFHVTTYVAVAFGPMNAIV